MIWHFQIYNKINKYLLYEKYQEIHDDFWEKNRKNVLSTILLTDFKKNKNNDILFSYIIMRYVE